MRNLKKKKCCWPASAVVTASRNEESSAPASDPTVLEAFIENEQLSDNRSLIRVVRQNVVDGMEHHQWSFAFLEFPRRVVAGEDLRIQVACIVMEEDEVSAGGRPILLRGDDLELIDDTYHDETLRACIVQNNNGDGESSTHLMSATSVAQNGRAAFTFTTFQPMMKLGSRLTIIWCTYTKPGQGKQTQKNTITHL